MPTSEDIWAISDGRAGLKNQALGLAEAVARLSPRNVVHKTVDLKRPWRALSATWLKGPLFGLPFSALTPSSDALAPPWPRVAIGCGRMSLPFLLAIKRASPNTFTVATQDPRLSAHHFDLVVPPLHDELAGDNVFAIHGSPNRIVRATLAEAGARFAKRYETLPLPRVGVLIGGSTKRRKLTRAAAHRIASELIALMKSTGAGLMVTTSRRTGEANAKLIARRLAGYHADVATGGADNPYFGVLELADFILVTEDSVNMTTEAAATGKPVYTLAMDGIGEKHERFQLSLRAQGITRPFAGALEPYTYEPLDETARAAAEIVRRASLASGERG